MSADHTAPDNFPSVDEGDTAGKRLVYLQEHLYYFYLKSMTYILSVCHRFADGGLLNAAL